MRTSRCNFRDNESFSRPVEYRWSVPPTTPRNVAPATIAIQKVRALDPVEPSKRTAFISDTNIASTMIVTGASRAAINAPAPNAIQFPRPAHQTIPAPNRIVFHIESALVGG